MRPKADQTSKISANDLDQNTQTTLKQQHKTQDGTVGLQKGDRHGEDVNDRFGSLENPFGDQIADLSSGEQGALDGLLPNASYDDITSRADQGVAFEAEVQSAPEVDPRSMVADDLFDEVMADVYGQEDEGTAPDGGGTPDGGTEVGEDVTGAGYKIPGVTYSPDEGFQGTPSQGTGSGFFNKLVDYLFAGAENSPKRQVIDAAMADIEDADSSIPDSQTPGETDPTESEPAEPASPLNGNEKEEEEDEGGLWDSIADFIFGDDEEAGTDDTTPDEGADPPPDENENGEEEDDTDDGTDDDGTNDTAVDEAADPPPEEQEDQDPESQQPRTMTDEQQDEAQDKWEGQRKWDVDPGWDDPSGDNPNPSDFRIDDGRPKVDPIEWIDGVPRELIEDIDTSVLDLAGRLGELVQPTDDDPDGIWGGPPSGGTPSDPFGGNNPVAVSTAGAMVADMSGAVSADFAGFSLKDQVADTSSEYDFFF